MIQKASLPVRKERILDMKKYTYWYKKSENFIRLMEQTDDNDKKLNNMKQAILCEFEKNKYCRLTNKEYLILKFLVYTYNKNRPNDKLYMDRYGLKSEGSQ